MGELQPYRERNAMAVCIFAILAISVSRTAFFLQPLPPSMQQAPIIGHLAALTLFLGCLGSLIGILWPGHDRGLLIEQFSSPLAGLGCFAYAAALLSASPFSNAAYAFGMSVGIGVFCVWRFAQIQRYVRHRRITGGGSSGGTS